MSLSDKIYNILGYIKDHFRLVSNLLLPCLVLIAFWVLDYYFCFADKKSATQAIPGIAGTLAGFLFTFLGIFIALPSNRFILALKKNGYMKVIYNTLIIGIISLLTSMVLGLFDVLPKITISLFIIGLSETYLSTYYLYKVSKFSLLSK